MSTKKSNNSIITSNPNESICLNQVKAIYQRATARVVILDEDDNALLFRGPGLINQGRDYLIPVGGGLEPGEATSQAACREVWEETGQKISPQDLIGPIAHTTGYWFTHNGIQFYSDDTFYLIRLPHFTIDMTNMEDAELIEIKEACWIPVQELQNSQYPLFPNGLSEVIKNYLTGAETISMPVELRSPAIPATI